MHFAVGKFEITLAERQLCMDAWQHATPADSGGCASSCRPSNVSWNEAKQFVAWLSRVTGKTLSSCCRNPSGNTRRGRAAQRMYAFGDDEAILGEPCLVTRTPRTAFASSVKKLPNHFGLYDMHGNVNRMGGGLLSPRELRWSAARRLGLWSGNVCSYRVVRGGCWQRPPRKVLRSAARSAGTSRLPTQHHRFPDRADAQSVSRTT